MDTGERHLANGNIRKHLYFHHSWNYRKTGKYERMTKSMGSKKMNRACPSKIEITNSEVKGVLTINVKFWKTHCGHAQDIGRVRLDKETRIMIAGTIIHLNNNLLINYLISHLFIFLVLAKLKEGVTWDHILDMVRETEIISETNQQLLLLERKDLRNISRDFNINYATRRHNDDAISVKLWVDEMQNLKDECPVLCFKAQDANDLYLEKKDFALIIMTRFQAQQLAKFVLIKFA